MQDSNTRTEFKVFAPKYDTSLESAGLKSL